MSGVAKLWGAAGAALLGLCVGGDALQERLDRVIDKTGVLKWNPVGGRDFFDPQSVDEKILQELDTGDVLLFDRRVLVLNPMRMIIRLVEKFYCGSEWDHVGVIIRRSDKDNSPYVLEFDPFQRGVSYMPYEHRILRSHDNQVALRKLRAQRTREGRKRVEDTALELVNRNEDIRPSTLGLGSHVLHMLWRGPPPTDDIVNATGELLAENERLLNAQKRLESFEGGMSSGVAFEARDKTQGELGNHARQMIRFRRKLRFMEASTAASSVGKTFHSPALVAKVLQDLGAVTPDKPPAAAYQCHHFLSQNKIPLTGGAYLMSENFVRTPSTRAV